MKAKSLFGIILFVAVSLCIRAQNVVPQFVSFSPEADGVSLAGAAIGYSEQEYEGVKMAIENLREDMQRVLGQKPQTSSISPLTSNILIGTLGKNKDIDRLKLPDLKGKREKFIITTVGNQVIIAGSDKRGTIYGIYELSRQLGVSPWYWWADARTCVLHPASHTHRQLSDEQLLEAGVAPDLIRLSVGIEDVEDVLDDIKQALEKI